MVSHAPVKNVTTPSQRPVKKSTIPCQRLVKKSPIPCHMVFQSVPNQPRITLAIPINVSHTAWNVPLIASQTPPNISCTPCQHRSQSPVNRPMKISKMPEITSNRPPRTEPISSNAPMNTGASNWQKPSHKGPIKSMNPVKRPPNKSNSSPRREKTPWNFSTMLFQISIILFLNSSFVSHKCLNAATNATTIAITTPTGPVRTVSAPSRPGNAAVRLATIPLPSAISPNIVEIVEPKPVMAPFTVPRMPDMPPKFLNPVISPPRIPSPALSAPMALEIVPMAVTSLPMMMSTGPIAASNPAKIRIACWIGAGRLVSHSTTLVNFSTNFVSHGITKSDRRIASDSKAPPNCSTRFCKLSCIISAVCLASPPQFFISSLSAAYSSSLRFRSAKRPD